MDFMKECAYSIVEGDYINQLKKQERYSNKDRFLDSQYFFPTNWASNKNYDLKIEFLKKAMEKDISLIELDGISVFDEGFTEILK